MTASSRKYTRTPIKGLILIGGMSSRMGRDKSKLSYHGVSQKEFAKQLLEDRGLESYFSVRDFLPDSQAGSTSLEMTKENSIKDAIPNLGPFGGIYSAFQQDTNSAWFVLATDLPFVNEELIELVLENRNPEKMATVVQGKNKEYPEPLIAIYEPKIYPALQQHLQKEQLSLVKILRNSDVEIIRVNDALIRNVNTLEEYEKAKKELN